MNKVFISSLAITIIFFTSCNSNNDGKVHEGHEMNKDTVQHASASADDSVKEVAVIYSNVDAKLTASIKEIVNHYLHIKNALANDKSSDAAEGADAMVKAIGNIDKSLLTAEQKKLYDDNEEDLKEHAEHIGKNSSNIKHQREHFSMMSEDVYALVKAFSAGQPLYHDHCPMYNEKKGAIWLSEIKEIKNPYYGGEMPTCGKVMEVIK
ncbi:MAG: DUF3347 domain-containing protein [Sphingobacteriales bacterium]|nr:MAG: DUF3347 domain-containing protein [Sphingobacteriales bacterium]